ncbi:MAG: energy-coupling factor ABC transporter ATP-binding protein [bacterium]|nr:energy-coupling factor ABC transporter ATP-binding protein [bacterium]
MFTFSQVRVNYNEIAALDVASLEIPSGGLSVVAGPNGSGKTTLLRVMAGLQPLSGGEVRYGGERVLLGRGGLSHRRRVTYLSQDPVLFRGKVFANVTYGPLAQGVESAEAEAKAREAIARTGCSHLADRRVNELSGGEKKRVALARALATGAEALLLDEPEVSLDAEQTLRLRETIEMLVGTGKMIVMSTHHLDWAGPVASRCYRLSYGKVLPGE